MKRFHILLLLLVACFATAMLAQAPATAPKPDPELKKLAVLVGHWTFEEDYKPGPMGPGGKTTGEFTGRSILRGFFFEAVVTEKGPAGETRYLQVYGYDPVNKNFSCSFYVDNGSTFSGTVTVSGNTYTWEGKFVVDGKEYRYKEPMILAADGMSATSKAEISTDGKTWTPFSESKITKAKPAPMK
jgi:hypothetical protein